MCIDCENSLSIPQGPQGPQGIQGIQGPAGTNGTNGVGIVWQGTLTSAPLTPETNWAYYNSVDGISYIWDGDSWEILAQDGAVGAQGPQGIQGATGDVSVISVTSSTSNSLTVASKTFTYTSTPTIGWLIGTRLRAYNSMGNFMEGTVTSVNSTSVTILIDYLEGSGTYTSWYITIAGVQGPIGLTGATGAIGPQGPVGPGSFIYETVDTNEVPAEATNGDEYLRRKVDDTGYEFIHFSQILANINYNTYNIGFNQF